MKLFLGNKAYSSWSLRGWLAARHSGLAFEEVTVPLYDEDWSNRREGDEFAPSGGKVPILWDGDDIVVWDSLAIIDYLNEKTQGARGYWPEDMAARAMARAMAAAMDARVAAPGRRPSMHTRRLYPAAELAPAVQAGVGRIMRIWAAGRARFGGEGDFLCGERSPAHRMSAPVVPRFIPY